jgi:NADH-ubiquinone oxidoreductase chain 6
MISNILINLNLINLISGISSILSIGLLTPVQSILWLIILFISTAISLYNNDFILMGLLYILIYVGAIAILFLFILSLLKIDFIPKGNISPLIITLLTICFIPLDLTYNINNIIININTTYNELVIVGLLLYTEYSILLIIISVILILSIVGAIAITK